MNPFKKNSTEQKFLGSIQDYLIQNKIDQEEGFDIVGLDLNQNDINFPSSINNDVNQMMTQSDTLSASRLARYKDYENMCKIGYLARGLRIYVNNVCKKDYHDNYYKILTNEVEIAKTLKTFFKKINLDKNLWKWTYNLFKYGDFFLKVNLNNIYNPEYIESVEVLNCYKVEKLIKEDKETKKKQLIGYMVDGVYYYPFQIIHFKINENLDDPYGFSILEPCREPFLYYKLLKDFIVIYRLERGVEKTVVNIPVGNMGKEKVTEYINLVKNAFKKRNLVDQNGNLITRLNPSNFFERYYIPVRDNSQQVKLEQVPAGQAITTLDDYKAIKDEMIAGLDIPNAYLGMESGGEMARANLAQLDINFARACERRQDDLLKGIYKLAYLELILRKVVNALNYKNFEIVLTPPSDLSEKLEIESIKTKYEMIQEILGLGVFPKNYVLKYFAKLSYSEILELEVALQKEKQKEEGGEENPKFGSRLGGSAGGFSGELGGPEEFGGLGGTEELGGAEEFGGTEVPENVGPEENVSAPTTGGETIPTGGGEMATPESKNYDINKILLEKVLDYLLEEKKKENHENFYLDELVLQEEMTGLYSSIAFKEKEIL